MIPIFFMVGCDSNEDESSLNENGSVTVTDDGAIAIEIAEVDDEYAFDVLQRINDAVAATDGLEIEFTTETLVIIPFEGIELPIELESETTGNLFALGADDSFKANGHIEQNHMGTLEAYGVYFREDAIYIDLTESHGLGVRTPLEVFNIFSLINIHTDFLEAEILEQSIETLGEDVVLVFSLNDTAMLEVINGQLNMEPFELENLGNYRYDFIVTLDENGAIVSLEVEIEFDYLRDEAEIEVSMVASTEISANDEITIEFPDHLSEFLPANTTIPVF